MYALIFVLCVKYVAFLIKTGEIVLFFYSVSMNHPL